MDSDTTIFTQLMDFIPRYDFRQCVERYDGNYKVKSFSCWDQFLCMAFAQLTYRESLRDIEACLRVARSKLYHMGIRGKVSRNTLANANHVRDWRIYADFARILIGIARPLFAEESFGVDLEQSAYALDSTIIDLCLSLFPWAQFRAHKAGVKLHTLLDLHGNIPTLAFITNAKVHDVNVLDLITYEPGALYIMDRGYLDFARLFSIHSGKAFFITRAKSNFRFKRLYSHPVDKTTGLRSDQTIVMKGFYARKDFPEKFRRIRYYDATHSKKSDIYNEQFPFACDDYRRFVSMSMAGRALFQVDQTTPSYQIVLRYIRKCSENANLDRYFHLCLGCYREKTTEIGSESLHNSTDFERLPVRENAHFAGSYTRFLRKLYSA